MKITCYEYPVPLSIALLSDLHNAQYEGIIAEVQSICPDIIAVTGDVILGNGTEEGKAVVSVQQNVMPFFKGCSSIAPTFFSFGNHEYLLSDLDLKLIRETGAIILDNEFVSYKGLTIGGLSSPRRTFYDKNKERFLTSGELYPSSEQKHQILLESKDCKPALDWLDEFEQQHGFKVLLSHHPELYDEFLSKRRIDLVLSGHCHGGQIRLFGKGLFAPGQGVFPKYTCGIYDKMIVSAGLSNTAGAIPRLFNPCEIVFISSKHSFARSESTEHSISHAGTRVAFECFENAEARNTICDPVNH